MKWGPGTKLAGAFVLLWMGLGAARLAQCEPVGDAAQYVEQRWQSSHGLPNDAIEAVVQTRDGYLWVATERGLSRFDGAHFRNFSRVNTPELAESYVSALCEGQDGTLWIGTSLNGLTAYADGVFRSVRLPVGLQGKVTAIREDNLGTLWVGTNSQGLVRLRDGRAEVMGEREGLAGRSVKSILVDHIGVVWVATEAGGVQSWDGQRFVSRIAAGELPGGEVSTLFEDSAGALWMASGKAVSTINRDRDPGTLRVVARSRTPIRALYVDVHGTDAADAADVWVGTATGGIELHQGSRTTYFNADHGFDIDTVQQLFRDREGSLWVATDGFGLVQLRVASFKTYTQGKAFVNNDIRAVTKGSDGTFWVGTGDGLSRWSHGLITPYVLHGDISNRDFRSLVEDRAGTLWVGTDGGGLYRVAKGTSAAVRVEEPLPSPVIMALAEDGGGGVWVGTTNGLAEISGGGTRAFTSENGLPSDVILALLADGSGRLWIGTPRGLATLTDGQLRTYGPADGIPADTMVSLYQDSEGEIWVGSYDGLFHWTGNGFQHWTTENGLFSNVVTDIVQGRHGDLWLRSNSEVSRVSRKELLEMPAGGVQAIKYDEQDGILKTVTGGGFPGSLRLEDGTLWFSSHKGLMTVDTDHLDTSRLAPPVAVSEVRVDGKPIVLNSGGKLRPGWGNLVFQFAALSFIEHDNLRFKYQLEGFDKDWIDAGPRTEAYYTNIPPGTYTFHVIAANRDGVWNGKGASIGFTLRAHYYQTWEFYLGCLVAALAGAGLFIRRRVRMREEVLVSKQHELEAVVSQRTAQLEEEKRQLLAAREDLRRQARRDGMTGLLNRGAILAELESELVRATRRGGSFGVAMVDIDHFKAVNDTYGHLFGDEVIRQVSARLQHAVRSYDAVGRYGGEEFLVILPDFDVLRDRVRVDRLREAIGMHPVCGDEHTLAVTCSVGVSLFDSEGICHAETLLASADLALYEAKRGGRDRVVFHGADASGKAGLRDGAELEPLEK